MSRCIRSRKNELIVAKTGFSQGVPDISNDDELAAQVAGFLEQFLDVFSELKGSNFWVSGESVSFYVYSNGRVTLTVIFQYAGCCGYRLENDLVTMLNDSYRRSIHRELSLRESQQGSSPKGHLDRRPDHQLVPRPVRDPGSPLRPGTSVGLC